MYLAVKKINIETFNKIINVKIAIFNAYNAGFIIHVVYKFQTCQKGEI